jgi:hypothetical protein
LICLGPFATARDILSKREEAKRKRDEDITKGDNKDIVIDVGEVDEYDKYLADLS